jgi:hypothetical protein
MESTMAQNGSLLVPSWLNVESNEGYGRRPIPNTRDQDISTLISNWMTLDIHARQEFSSLVTDGQRPTLLAYSERMATLAVRKSNKEWIRFGLIAQGMDGWRADWRESALLLSLHYDACNRINESAATVFSEVAAMLPLNVGHAMTSFVKRAPPDIALEAMGYKASGDQDGFRYERTW